eukprot:24301-Eustigmatos_ZCMA.PRE.1
MVAATKGHFLLGHEMTNGHKGTTALDEETAWMRGRGDCSLGEFVANKLEVLLLSAWRDAQQHVDRGVGLSTRQQQQRGGESFR